MNQNKKICSKCKQTKSISEFYKRNKSKDGLTYACKTCYYNPEKQKQYYEDNKEYYIERQQKINKRRYDTNEAYRITCRLRSRLHTAIKNQNSSKFVPYNLLVGCSSDFLIKWLNFNKSTNVTDENPHIDHVIPCSAFNLLKESEQRKCFNWRNLRYMNAKDNLKKSNKINTIDILINDVMADVFEELINESK